MPPSRRPGIAPIVLALTVTAVLALGSCASGAPPPVSDVQAQSGEENPGSPLEVAVRERLVTLSEEAPLVRDNVGHHGVHIGGITVLGARVVVVATIDNLLKGSSSWLRAPRGSSRREPPCWRSSV